MQYDQGAQYMRSLCQRGERGTLAVYKGLVVHYPGCKENGDYRLEIEGWGAPEHKTVCIMLGNAIQGGQFSFQSLYGLLERTYQYGTGRWEPHEGLRYWQHLIYWMTLQEDINYPMEQGKKGRRLPYCRYFEAIYSTQDNPVTLEEVLERCGNHGKKAPPLYPIAGAPGYYW